MRIGGRDSLWCTKLTHEMRTFLGEAAFSQGPAIAGRRSGSGNRSRIILRRIAVRAHGMWSSQVPQGGGGGNLCGRHAGTGNLSYRGSLGHVIAVRLRAWSRSGCVNLAGVGGSLKRHRFPHPIQKTAVGMGCGRIGTTAAQNGISEGLVMTDPVNHSQPACESQKEHEEEEIRSNYQPLSEGLKTQPLEGAIPGCSLLRCFAMIMVAVIMVVFKTQELSHRIMTMLVMTVTVVVAVIMTMVCTTVRTTAIHENAAQGTYLGRHPYIR